MCLGRSDNGSVCYWAHIHCGCVRPAIRTGARCALNVGAVVVAVEIWYCLYTYPGGSINVPRREITRGGRS